MRPLVIPFRLVFARITTDVGFGHNNYMKEASVLREEPILLSPRSRFRAAMILAMAADALQIFVFPLFAEGALSPADDVLDVAGRRRAGKPARVAVGIPARSRG